MPTYNTTITGETESISTSLFWLLFSLTAVIVGIGSLLGILVLYIMSQPELMQLLGTM